MFKSILLGILFYITANCLYAGGDWIISFEASGYGSKIWRDAQIIKKINELPSDNIIVSNKEDAIYILCNRIAWPLPFKTKYDTYKPNEEYYKELSKIRKGLQKTGGFIVYFCIENWEEANLPSEEELKEQLPLRLFWKGAEGTIYRFENQ